MEDKEETHLIHVFEDGETWTMEEPLAVSVTGEQISRIKDGEKVSDVIPDWDSPKRITSVEAVESGSANVEKYLEAIVAKDQNGLELSDFNPMPLTAMESAQKYIDEDESESNVYELCSVCQESFNPDRPHECVDIEGMKTELLRYLLKDVEENFEHLTRTERKIIGSQENFDRLLSALRNGGES